jgi:hypothetical protein
MGGAERGRDKYIAEPFTINSVLVADEGIQERRYAVSLLVLWSI